MPAEQGSCTMLITTYGSPSVFGQTGNRIMKALGNALFPDCFHLSVNTIEELREFVFGRKTPNIVLFSEFPERNLIEVTRRINPSAIIFYEDPTDIVGYMLRHRKLVWPAALQAACQTLATTADLMSNPGTLVIERSEDHTFTLLLGHILRYLGLTLTPEQDAAFAAAMGLASPEQLDEPIEAHMAGWFEDYRPPSYGSLELSAEVVELIEQVLTPLRNIRKRQTPGEVGWPIEVFFSQTAQRATSGITRVPLDLLGPARYLYFGPYLYLPPGLWGLKAEFEVQENASLNRIEVDVCQGDHVLAFGVYDLPERGQFKFTAGIRIEQPEWPIEFRIHMKEGAIEGLFELKSVTWTYLNNADLATQSWERRAIASQQP